MGVVIVPKKEEDGSVKFWNSCDNWIYKQIFHVWWVGCSFLN